MQKLDAVTVHSGGMDSSICLALAIQEFGKEKVLSLGFDYGQRNDPELTQAKKICQKFGVERHVIAIPCLKDISENSMTNHNLAIEQNTLVLGRNGLMARLAAIYAHEKGADQIFMGIMELEVANSGYRDCSRHYMNLMQEILRIDLDNPEFMIRTPLVQMTKAETMALANQMGHLDFLWENTITCYEGLPKEGCKMCPACKLRNAGMAEFLAISKKAKV